MSDLTTIYQQAKIFTGGEMMKKSARFVLLFVCIALFLACSPAVGRKIMTDVKIPEGVKAAKIYHPDYNFQIRFFKDRQVYVLTSKDKALKVPPEKLGFVAIRLIKQDKDKNEWKIQSGVLRDGRKITVFSLGAGEKMNLKKYGEPFEVKPIIRENRISYAIFDKSGQKYSALYKNGKSLPPFAFKIVGPDGKVIDQGRFKYG